jgi:ABC-2 type transport system permease protein
MQTNPKNSLTGLTAILGVIALLAGLIIMLILPEIRYAAWIILGLGVILLATAFITGFQRVGTALVSKRGRFSAGTTLMVSVFIGIILLANAISIGNYHRFDLTGVAQFTLTSQTKEILNNMETPVEVIIFSTPDEPYGITDYITSLLLEYQNQADKLKLSSIDPEQQPDQARNYEIYTYPTVIFESANGYRSVLPQDVIMVVGTEEEYEYAVDAEHAFTSAILEVTGTIQKKVYFLTGHGEGDIYDDYLYAANGLRDNLFTVDALDLVATPAIPDDCAALIIAGPQTSLSSNEIEIIQSYLYNNGQALIMINPNTPTEIKQLLYYWGALVGDGTIIDPTSYLSPNKDSPSSSRDTNYFGLSSVYFPGATAIILQPEFEPTLITSEDEETQQYVWISEDSPIAMYMLIWTSEDSWLEWELEPDQEPDYNEETDIKGPLAISFLIYTTPSDESSGEEGTAIIVIGDSDFASNEHFYNGENSDLFLTSVNWLTMGEEIISIDRKVVSFRRLIIGSEEETFIKISSIGLLPLIVLITGGVIWWRRR